MKRKFFNVSGIIVLGMILSLTSGCSKEEDDSNIVKDADGNTYTTVKIGNQIWMAENLKVTKYNDGTPIENVTVDADWSDMTTGGYGENGTYGNLYNWYAVNSGKLAPKGWHIPTHEEWEELTAFLLTNNYGYPGLNMNYYYIAKSVASTTGWAESTNEYVPGNDQASNNRSGFNAYPAGGRSIPTGIILYTGIYAYFWSSTAYSQAYAFYVSLKNDIPLIYEDNAADINLGLSVRCIKD